MLLILLIAFLIAANPATYRATRGVLGSWVASQEGTARMGGLLLHAVVFIALVMILKRVKRAVSPYHVEYMHAADDMDTIDGMSTKTQDTPYSL